MIRFRYFTFLRFFNVIKISLSYLLSYLFKKSIYFGKPYAVSIEISSICNLACHQCLVGRKEIKRRTDLMKLEDFKHILNKLPKEVFYINLYFQGEPLLNPDIFEMIRLAKAKNCYTLISTNGTLLDTHYCAKLIGSGLDKLIISLDGSNQRIYSKYRSGGNIQQVLIGVETLQKMKRMVPSRFPKLEIQAIVLKTNEDDLPNIRQIALNHHVESLVLKSAQIYDLKNNTHLLPQNPYYSRYKMDAQGEYVLKNRNTSTCGKLWFGNVITCDGDFLPCCYDKNAENSFGNILESTYNQLIYGSRAKVFRKKVCKNRKDILICNHCI